MILSRYLFREVSNNLIIVMLVLMLVFISQQIVRYLNYVAVGKIPASLLLYLISFETPYLFALLLPLALFLSILIVYGRLYADHEMLMMYMGGFRYTQLLRLTAQLSLGVSIVIWVFMLWVNPLISAKRQELMTSKDATLHLIRTLVPGRFQTSLDERHVMYVEKLSRDHARAENIFLAQEIKSPENKENKWILFTARQGYQIIDPMTVGPIFVMVDGYRYEGTPGQNDYKITQFKKYSLRVPQLELRTSHTEVEAQSMQQLWSRHDEPKTAAEFEWRISIGLSAFLLGLLAVPLSRVKPKKGRFLILLPAILIYIIYINLLVVSRHWLEQGSISPLVGMWWVHGLLLIIMGMLFGKLNANP